jgi:flavin-binding protein dodecin
MLARRRIFGIEQQQGQRIAHERCVSHAKETSMPDKTYKIIEVVGVSEDSVQQAVRNAITKARETIRNIDWFEVGNIRGSVNKAGDLTFQVEVRIGFRLEGDAVV